MNNSAVLMTKSATEFKTNSVHKFDQLRVLSREDRMFIFTFCDLNKVENSVIVIVSVSGTDSLNCGTNYYQFQVATSWIQTLNFNSHQNLKLQCFQNTAVTCIS
jgi:hypothetical protein